MQCFNNFRSKSMNFDSNYAKTHENRTRKIKEKTRLSSNELNQFFTQMKKEIRESLRFHTRFLELSTSKMIYKFIYPAPILSSFAFPFPDVLHFNGVVSPSNSSRYFKLSKSLLKILKSSKTEKEITLLIKNGETHFQSPE